MQPIIDITGYASDGKDSHRDFDKLEGIMVHRCGVDSQTGTVLGYEAKEVIDEFLGRGKYPAVAKATGGQNAYSIYIGGNLGPTEFDGRIWQALPLDEVGYHGRRFSVPFLGIGLIFDGRVAPASEAQYNSLVDLCASLCAAWLWDPYRKIKGHGEVAKAHDGSKAPGKPAACPGDLLSMNALRDDVATMMKDTSRRKLHAAGLLFS